MKRLVPIIRPAVSPLRLLQAVFIQRPDDEDVFCAELARLTGRGSVLCASSGAAALYFILSALKQMSGRREVVLPAYTAGSLVVAVRQAGLVPVLCDISLDDFNMDLQRLPELVNGQTLAVIAVHMFGIPQQGIAGLRAVLPQEVFLIEDCCQAMGSTVDAKPVGTFSDISFYSFGRGKNANLGGGGCICVDDAGLEAVLRSQLAAAAPAGCCAQAGLFVSMAAVNAASHPMMYGMLASVAGRFRESAPPATIRAGRLSRLQAALGRRTISSWPRCFSRRVEIGAMVLEGATCATHLRLPRVPGGCAAAFNRVPMLLPDAAAAARAQEALRCCGIEASPMYRQPLHRMFAGLERRQDVPVAEEFSRRLLTLPVYPGLAEKDIQTMIEVIRQCCR